MLIPSIDLLGGRIVQLVQGEKLRLAFDDFEYWIEKFSKYPLVQLIDLAAHAKCLLPVQSASSSAPRSFLQKAR